MEQPLSMLIATNGHWSVFDEKEESIIIPEYKMWTALIFEELEKKGVDPTKIKEITAWMNGQKVNLEPFKLEDGTWNCYIKPQY